MAEKLVSPGVFTRENDLSFLQQGVAEIGAAFIGPFKEGPLVPTIVNSQAEFEQYYGIADDTYYTPLAVQNYLREAGTVTVCRVAGVGGYTAQNPILVKAVSGSVSASLAVLFSTSAATGGLSDTTITAINEGANSGSFIISGSGLGFNGTASLDYEKSNNVEAVFGTSALGSKGGYVVSLVKNPAFTLAHATASVVVLNDQSFTFDAQEALTPWIQSQNISGQRYDLFRFETIGAGNVANTKVKVAISNVKPAGSVSGTDYGTFTVVIREFGDTDNKKTSLETYANINLDPNSPNYIARVIGDRKISIDALGKVTETGDWVNNSKYIRVSVKNADLIPVQAVPYAHAAYQMPVSGSGADILTIPSVKYTTGSVADSKFFSGIDLDTVLVRDSNKFYLRPIPTGASTGSNTAFSLDTTCSLPLTGSAAADLAKRQFIVAFQQGFDGMAPYTPIYKGSDIVAGNSQGFDLSTSTASGSVAYGKVVAALSNDLFDINMVVTPGVIRRLHPSVVTDVLDMVEQRSDCFYIFDGVGPTDTVQQAITDSAAVDSNYAASYYPWVKTVDVNTNKLITIPPSVLLPGVFAANDRVAAEWFAPAGLNRGGLVGAVAVLNRLTQAEKDTLYEGKVNPIVQFPGQGIVVFGQKTLQDKPSALDRINVRRLLLTVRKYIASTSRYLVFEQNSSTTRNRFINIVTPYLDGIQQRQGLYAFRVVMDESNNTPDVIDRNILKGAIFLQPTKTAEFIQIDFNILPTGASFGA
jgi:hypothetical protein